MRIVLLFIFILFLTQITIAGFGVATQKDNINVEVGSTDTFQYEIQTIGSSYTQQCTFSLQQEIPLQIVFDSSNIYFPPNSRTQVFGSVKVPENTQIGSYQTTFCVVCNALTDTKQGTSVSQPICNIPLKVNVLEKNQLIEQTLQKNFPNSLLIVAVIILIIGILFTLKGFKNKNLNIYKR